MSKHRWNQPLCIILSRAFLAVPIQSHPRGNFTKSQGCLPPKFWVECCLWLIPLPPSRLCAMHRTNLVSCGLPANASARFAPKPLIMLRINSSLTHMGREDRGNTIVVMLKPAVGERDEPPVHYPTVVVEQAPAPSCKSGARSQAQLNPESRDLFSGVIIRVHQTVKSLGYS